MASALSRPPSGLVIFDVFWHLGRTMQNAFVHLRLHTPYSMSEGAIPIKTLGKTCRERGMPAVAITDTRNLFGGLEFSVTLAADGVQPIIGCQVAVERGGDTDPPRGRPDMVPDQFDDLVLLCQNAVGYSNLIALISHAFMAAESGEIPKIRRPDLESRSEGLLCLTGGVSGPVGYRILNGGSQPAEAELQWLGSVFPGRLYMEIQRHDTPEENRTEPVFLDLAYKHGLPLVATNDCYFPDRELFEAHDVLICMSQKLTVSATERRRLTPEHYLKSAAEMRELFQDLPEAIDNTLTIARRCAVMVEKRKPILPRSARAVDSSEEDVLRQMAREGLERRLPVHVYMPGMTEDEKEKVAAPYYQRLAFELDVIIQMGFPGYFIIVADFIQWAKDNDVPVGPGRGSGAGSLVAWALTITDLDPLRFQLLFERFLNPERVSMPDFDIDFCQERRGEVIDYVQKTYGRDRVAQIITFGKLQARAVLRSVGRVLEMPLGYVDRICKLVPNNPANPVSLQEAIVQEPQLQALRDSDPQVAQLLSIGQRLEGLYSHASTHAAGVVIGDRPLDQLVPMYRDPGSDMPVTQFNMKWVESAGLVKFDFLGLKTLTVLQKAVNLLRERGIQIDLSSLPLDDPKTYDMLGRGEAAGVFQLESQGMRDVLTRMKPDCLEDIIAVVALYRPGPMDNIPSYIARKQGTEPIDYMHPSLEPILKETYGIMIYQEQVMQAAQVLAGYSLGTADLLRRAMGKKIKEEMDQQRAMFVQGCAERGIASGQASGIFDTIAKFAGYGFNKSHAAAYAYVAYQTAYMKANYPVEFMAAIMTYDMHNTDKLASFRGELQRLGIPLLPPDINASDVQFSVEFGDASPQGAVRYALAAVRNVGEAAMQGLVTERRSRGAFRSVQDFAGRVDSRAINKRLLESLVRAGAFDCLEPSRARLFAGIELLLRHAQAAAEARASSQVSLFGPADTVPRFDLPTGEEWSRTDILNEERAAIGFFLSAHPLDAYKTTLERLDAVPSSDLVMYLRNGGQTPVRMAAIVGGRKEKTGRNGSRYAFVSLSDAGGGYEAMFFSEILSSSRDLLDSGKPLLLSVDARLDGDQVRLSVQHVESLDNAVSRATKKIMIVFDVPSCLCKVRQIIDADAKGHGRVVLVARTRFQEVEMPLRQGFALSGHTIGALKDVPGVLEVREI